ncbi:sigma-70 family RNA polymerase sigma factor [Cohnella sp. CFH 77786]|uniref:sigma-70 family RNA polymerase sigma factor n=1 Tax=Cohnella sp. CFH 77786 TaxID=2662265 RepID=UPI001C60C3CB|nr:sigma-70 family RNA polymerase sigma factor [Cohnella sp. CFH 77786]MBW5448930.1 sigma-70 family RNA polymerase sigma factor [Cohnella sp. CFH 77786]
MELLIKKAQKGDEEAFIQAINEYLPPMYKIAKIRLHSEDDIGDAIQDTILAAYRDLHKLRQPRFFKTWITRILINKCNDIVQSRGKVVYVEDYSQLGEGSLSFTHPDLEGEIDFSRTLTMLSESHRTVIILHYVNGFTSREIGEILNEKENTIKSQLNRARQKLKEFYLNGNGQVQPNTSGGLTQ